MFHIHLIHITNASFLKPHLEKQTILDYLYKLYLAACMIALDDCLSG